MALSQPGRSSLSSVCKSHDSWTVEQLEFTWLSFLVYVLHGLWQGSKPGDLLFMEEFPCFYHHSSSKMEKSFWPTWNTVSQTQAAFSFNVLPKLFFPPPSWFLLCSSQWALCNQSRFMWESHCLAGLVRVVNVMIHRHAACGSTPLMLNSRVFIKWKLARNSCCAH